MATKRERALERTVARLEEVLQSLESENDLEPCQCEQNDEFTEREVELLEEVNELGVELLAMATEPGFPIEAFEERERAAELAWHIYWEYLKACLKHEDLVADMKREIEGGKARDWVKAYVEVVPFNETLFRLVLEAWRMPEPPDFDLTAVIKKWDTFTSLEQHSYLRRVRNEISGEVMSEKLIYRENLDAIVARGCGECGCDHDHGEGMFFFCRCEGEVRGNIEASYRKRDGSLVVGCRTCGRTVAEVAVAAEAT